MTPSTSARLLTRRSLAPNTAARKRARHPGPAAGGESAHDSLVDPLVGGDRGGGVGVVAVWRSGLRALGESEHGHRTEAPREERRPRIRAAPRRTGPASSPSSRDQWAACRSSASASPGRTLPDLSGNGAHVALGAIPGSWPFHIAVLALVGTDAGGTGSPRRSAGTDARHMTAGST